MAELESYGVKLGGVDAAAVCVGFDTELTYDKLDTAVHFLRRGAAFIAANPDWVCPMPADEVLPDCGSICALLTAATGVKPTVIGKPDRRMVDIISKQRGVTNSKICCCSSTPQCWCLFQRFSKWRARSMSTSSSTKKARRCI